MNRQVDDRTTSKGNEEEPDRSRDGDSMIRKKQVERDVEETLRAFRDDPGPEAVPDLYAGIQRKIRALAPSPRPQGRSFSQKVLIPAVLILMLVLNIAMTVFVSRTKKIEFEAREKGMAALSEDFTAGQSAFLSYLK